MRAWRMEQGKYTRWPIMREGGVVKWVLEVLDKCGDGVNTTLERADVRRVM